MAETEKQTQQIIDDPCHVFVREWQFSLSCRVHADYSIRQKEFHTRWKDWQRFTWCCGMACLSFSLISPLSTSSLFVCLSLSLSRSLSVRVSYWLSQIPLVRRVLFGLTWDKNRPTICYSCCCSLEWDCDVQVLPGPGAIITRRPIVQTNRTTPDTKRVDNLVYTYVAPHIICQNLVVVNIISANSDKVFLYPSSSTV